MANAIPMIWASLVLLLGPVAGVAGRRKLATEVPARRTIYVANVANLLLLGILTLIVDLTSGRTAVKTLVHWAPAGRIATWSVGLSVICLFVSGAIFLLRLRTARPPRPAVLAILPQSFGERAGFIVVCLVTGFVEEFVYRGFVLTRLTEWLASPSISLLLVSASFALMHGIQDRVAIGAAFLQGILLGTSLLVVHSLVPSIAAHIVVDLAAGFYFLPVAMHKFSDSGRSNPIEHEVTSAADE
jgi:membrane protease YdiL (CAAX protease family)